MDTVSTYPPHISVIRKTPETWYTIADGSFSNPAIWISNGKKKHGHPQSGDDVYINKVVTCDLTITLRNIYISGELKLDNNDNTLTVTGDLQATGTLDQSAGTSTVILNGYNNYVSNFNPGIASTLIYAGSYSQDIMPLSYNNLTLEGGNKRQTAHLSVYGNLLLSTPLLDTNGYNLLISGSTNHTQTTVIRSDDTILFAGLMKKTTGQDFTIAGNANIEVRAGIRGSVTDWSGSDVNFTTNNQSFDIVLRCINVIISGPITVDCDSELMATGIIDGTHALSTLNNNWSVHQYGITTPMATGVFNYRNSPGSTMIYDYSGDYTLPYTVYECLYINAGGTKGISGDLTVNFDLQLTGGAVLELGIYNLSVGREATLAARLSKTGAGSVLFKGLLFINHGGETSTLSGNPTIEVRGGISLNTGFPDLGTAIINVTTNNQTFNIGDVVNNDILIDSGITLTLAGSGGGSIYNGAINGASSTSVFDNRDICIYKNARQPMLTGIFYCDQAANTFIYGASGDQDITPGTYNDLTLSGSGVKQLLGNVSATGVYTLTSPATLNLNGYTLTNP